MLTKKHKPYNRYYFENKNKLRPSRYNKVIHRDLERRLFYVLPLGSYKHANKYIKKRYKTTKKVYREIINYMFKDVASLMLEERDGVYLKGIGYFFMFMTPRPGATYNGKHSTNIMGRRYYPMFRADGRNNPLMDFYIPYRKYRREAELRERVANNQLYTHNLSLLQDKGVEEAYKKVVEKGKINRKKYEFYRAARKNQEEFQIARFLRAIGRTVDI